MRENIKQRERGRKENVKDKEMPVIVVVLVVGASGSNIGDGTPQNDKQRDIWARAVAVGKAQQMQESENIKQPPLWF